MEQRVTSTLLSCNCWNKGSTSAPHLIHRFTNSLLPAPPAVNFWTSSLESFAFPVFTLGVHRRLIAWVAAESFRDRTRPPLRARFFRRSCFMQGEKATHPNIDPKSFYTCKVKKRLWKYRLLACHELFWWNFKYTIYYNIYIYVIYIYTLLPALRAHGSHHPHSFRTLDFGDFRGGFGDFEATAWDDPEWGWKWNLAKGWGEAKGELYTQWKSLHILGVWGC